VRKMKYGYRITVFWLQLQYIYGEYSILWADIVAVQIRVPYKYVQFHVKCYIFLYLFFRIIKKIDVFSY
jgi:hypothetical protein